MHADLAPLIKTHSVPVAQYLTAAVARADLDLLCIQRDLEAEGVEWSVSKTQRVTSALKSLMQQHPKLDEEAKAGLKVSLGEKCVQTKQSQLVVDAIVDSLDAKQTQVMRLQELVDFQLLIRHDFSSLECKNIGETRAQLAFKVRESDGHIGMRRLEVSIDELQRLRRELERVEETLS